MAATEPSAALVRMLRRGGEFRRDWVIRSSVWPPCFSKFIGVAATYPDRAKPARGRLGLSAAFPAAICGRGGGTGGTPAGFAHRRECDSVCFIQKETSEKFTRGRIQWLAFTGEICFGCPAPGRWRQKAGGSLQSLRPRARRPMPRPQQCIGCAGTTSFPPQTNF